MTSQEVMIESAAFLDTDARAENDRIRLDIQQHLDDLADARVRLDALDIERDVLRRAAIPAEVQARLDDIDLELTPRREMATEAVARLEKQVRESVHIFGETVTGEWLQAVYNHGERGWEDDKLIGYAAAHPEILQWRVMGKPSITIRTLGVKSK